MQPSCKLNHKIWQLAWPMIISNLSVPLLGLVDTAVLGHLDSASFLSAVAIGSSILAFIYWGFGFLRMGTTGAAAQAFGAEQHDQSRLIISQSLLLSLGLALVILFLSPWLLDLGLLLVSPPAGAEYLATEYMSLRILSAPAVLINYVIIGWLIGRQNTRWPLLITLFTNCLNIILDLLLIIGLGLNSEGAALATVIAEYCGCGLALLILQRQWRLMPGMLNHHQLTVWSDYRDLLITNSHLFIRTLVLLASFAFFTAKGAQQGESILAANTILIQLAMLTAFGLDGFAHAAEALTGDAVGKRQLSIFYQVCKGCAFWSICTAVIFTVAYNLIGHPIIHLMTSLEEVRVLAKQYLPWLTFLPLIAIWSYLLDGIFIGASRSKAMQYTMLISAGLVYLPSWYFTQSWGNHGLWFAFLAFNGARGITLGYIFYRHYRLNNWW